MDSDLKSLKSSGALSIRKIIEGRQFRVPLYQRNYKWGKETAAKLAADLLEGYKKTEEEGHEITKSIGLLTLHQSKDSEGRECLYIIDGQQRFITLSIIFSLLRGEGEDLPINLSFERDDKNNTRINAIGKKYEENWSESSTDEDRIMRNKEEIKKTLEDSEKGIKDEKKKAFANYILDYCVMLCSVVEADPEKEFMNLNAYKTRFSACDYVRANLISLNSFYRKELEKNNSLIAPCLEKHSYKTAIAYLYDDILNILYSDLQESGNYKSVYSVVQGNYSDPDQNKESRINILFTKELPSTEKGYFSDEINKTVEEWIQMLLKLACAKRLLAQLEREMTDHNFSSAKEIDDYQKLKKKNFLDLVMNLDDVKEKIDTITLAKLLKENSNVGYVLMKELEGTDLKLANRYFESFVFSSINKPTVTFAEKHADDRIELPQMSDEEVISCIQGAGQYVIARFLDEQKQAADASVVIAPVLDLKDREHLVFGGKIDLEEGDTDTISVRKLFRHKFKIPVIQRDYCMGARIDAKKEADDFLGFLIKNFQDNKEVIASTILISVENDTNDIYVFDGQQRLYTIYQLLRCGNNDAGDDKFTFVGRNSGASRYSVRAVDNLQDAIKNRKVNKNLEEFQEFLRNNVKFKVKVAGTVSDAEQFFMDINGGVSLKEYEIFKSSLCERLAALGKTDFIEKMENQWLNWFYRFQNIKKDDEKDIEEWIEMRFIEFLCGFFIMKRTGSTGLPVFDCIGSKNELVGKLKYLEDLSVEDIANIEKVMDYLVKNEEAIKGLSTSKLDIECFSCSNPNSEKRHYYDFDIDSYGNKLGIVYYFLSQDEIQRDKFIDKYKDYILHRFIDSLSDKKREALQKYYSWKNIDSLMKIYGADQLIRDCILHILGDGIGIGKYPYAEKRNVKMYFGGGYRTEIIEGPEFIPEQEIPIYYAESFPGSNCVRVNYLYDQVMAKHPELKDEEGITLNFILTDNGAYTIKREDGTRTYIAFLNSGDSKPKMLEWRYYEPYCGISIGGKTVEALTNRTDAYLLKNKNTLNKLSPERIG